jgi:hypothetical protein
MIRVLFICGSLFLAAGAIMEGGSPGPRVPVLLELFTSEGCSSCPPADRFLEKLDREQPVAGADLIVLSEHVDYWNQLGWADPFSSSLYSQRQREYASHQGGEVYTPELMIDGQKGLVGSDEREVLQAVRDAARGQKPPLHVTAEQVDRQARIIVHMDEPGDGILYVALAHDAMKSNVLRGENAGRGLSHVAVVYAIQKVGKVDRQSDHEIRIAFPQGISGDKTRVVAFVEKTAGARVVAIGQARL